MKKTFLILAIALGVIATSCSYLYKEDATTSQDSKQVTYNTKSTTVGEGGDAGLPDSGSKKLCRYRAWNENGVLSFKCNIIGRECRCEGGQAIKEDPIDLETLQMFFPKIEKLEDIYQYDINQNEEFVKYLNNLRGYE